MWVTEAGETGRREPGTPTACAAYHRQLGEFNCLSHRPSEGFAITSVIRSPERNGAPRGTQRGVLRWGTEKDPFGGRGPNLPAGFQAKVCCSQEGSGVGGGSVTNLISGGKHARQGRCVPQLCRLDFTGGGSRVAAADTRSQAQSSASRAGWGPGNARARMTQKPPVTIAPAEGPVANATTKTDGLPARGTQASL